MALRHLVCVVPLLALAPACAAQERMVPPDAFLADVAWLADDARGGRDTGSPGLAEAAEWVAREFEEAGLQPAGDAGGWMQAFEVPGARRLVEGNALALGGRELRLHDEWLPLQTALSGDVDAPLVFCGYGIHDPDGGWDDFAGVDVKDKVVLALRKGPRVDVPGTRYAENGDGWEKITFAAKVNAAFRQGAAALLVVNDPAHHGEGGDADEPNRYRPLGGGRDGIAASLPAASLSLAAARAALPGVDLAALQRALDEAGQPRSFAVEGVTARLAVRSQRETVQSANVLGFLPGNDPALEGEWLLLGAHLDHLGLGEGGGSRGGRDVRGQIHNGADDNASGTAGLVGLARLLGARRGELRRGVMFAAWSAEERGLLGSEHFVRNPARPLDGLVAKLNMDMIGRSTDGYVAVEGVDSAAEFRELVVQAHDALGLSLDLHLAGKPSPNSDQWPFFREGRPVLAFFTGLHGDYHLPSDDTEKINAEGGARIASLAGEIAWRLAQADARPAFTRPAGVEEATAAAAPRDAAAAPGHGDPGTLPASSAYRVVLGTSPDMTYQAEDGVLLSGVREDTPAQRAGLQKGDLIVAFDGKPVRTLEDYSMLLFAHKPGDTVSITIRRGGETLELQARLEGKIGDN